MTVFANNQLEYAKEDLALARDSTYNTRIQRRIQDLISSLDSILNDPEWKVDLQKELEHLDEMEARADASSY